MTEAYRPDQSAAIRNLDQRDRRDGWISREVIGNILSSVGNYEPKALLLSMMRAGQRYTGDELAITYLQGRGVILDGGLGTPSGRRTHTNQVESFCDTSLVRIGMVIKEQVVNNGRLQFEYEISERGERVGKAFAGHLNILSERHPQFALLNFFGPTASGAAEKEVVGEDGMTVKNRAPMLRLRIFEELVSEHPPKSLSELADRLGQPTTKLTSHLRSLHTSGILRYESITADESLAQFVKGDGFEGHGVVSFGEEKHPGLTDDVFLEMLVDADQTDAPQQTSVEDIQARVIVSNSRRAGHNQGTLGRNIGEILRHLDRRGYVTRKKEVRYTVNPDRPDAPPSNIARREIALLGNVYGIIQGMDGRITPHTVRDKLLEIDPGKAQSQQDSLVRSIARVLNHLERHGYTAGHGRQVPKYTLRDDRPMQVPTDGTLSATEQAHIGEVYEVAKQIDGTITTRGVLDIMLAEGSTSVADNPSSHDRVGAALNKLSQSGVMDVHGDRFAEFTVREDRPTDPPPPLVMVRFDTFLTEVLTTAQGMEGSFTKADLRQKLLEADPTRVERSQQHLDDMISQVTFHLEENGYFDSQTDEQFTLRADRPDDAPPPLYTQGDMSLGRAMVDAIDGIDGLITITAVREKMEADGTIPEGADPEHLFHRMSNILGHLEDSELLARANFEKGTYSRISQTPDQKAVCAELVDIVHNVESGDEAFIDEGRVLAEEIAADPARVAALYDKAREKSPVVGKSSKAEIEGRILEIIGDNQVEGVRLVTIHKQLSERFGISLSTAYVANIMTGLSKPDRDCLSKEKDGRGFLYRPVDGQQQEQSEQEDKPGGTEAAAIAMPTVSEPVEPEGTGQQATAQVSEPVVDIFTAGIVSSETPPQENPQEVSGSGQMSDDDVLAHYFANDTESSPQNSGPSEQSIIFQHYGLDDPTVQPVDLPQHERTANHPEIDE